MQRSTVTLAAPVLAIASLTVLAGVWACGPTPQQRYQQRVEETGPPALHAVYSDRLREVMGDLNEIMYGRLPTMVDTDAAKKKLLADVKTIAGDLRTAATAIDDVAPQLDLRAEEKTAFLGLVTKLQTQAKLLKEQADRNMADELPLTLDQMRTTCTACHNLFQGPPAMTMR